MNLSLNDQNRVYVSASLVALPLLLLWTWRQRRLSAIEAADMAEAPSKTVVIIGGSVGGINAAHGVLKQIPNAKVILINPSGNYSPFLASIVFCTFDPFSTILNVKQIR